MDNVAYCDLCEMDLAYCEHGLAERLSMAMRKWLWPNCRDGSVTEQDALADQVGFRSPVHLFNQRGQTENPACGPLLCLDRGAA
jgi:hypothetical protein